MSIKHSILATSVIMALSLVGCGGDSSPKSESSDSTSNSTPSKPVNSAKQGQFIDAAVEGLYYEATPSGKSGFTDADGIYDYEEGDTIAFFLGGAEGLRIGNTSSRKVTSPFEVTGNFQKGLNLARILQSMDDASNGYITLPDSIKSPSAKMIAALNNVTLHDLDSASDLKNELNLTAWVTEEKALIHLNDSLKELERGSKEILTDWRKGSGKYLRTVDSTIAAKNNDSENMRLYLHADKLLSEEVFDATRGMPTMTLRLGKQYMTVLKGSNDSQISEMFAKLYLTCLEQKGADAAFVTPNESSNGIAQCDGEDLNDYSDTFELGEFFDYALLSPTSASKTDENEEWEQVAKFGTLYKCIADESCSEAKLTGFEVTSYDDSDKQDGSYVVNNQLSTSYDSVTGVHTQVNKRTVTSGSQKGRVSESLSFAYLVDSPDDERYVDFVGTWHAVSTRSGCDNVAKSTYTFDEKGVSVTGDEFSRGCQVSAISETASYSDLSMMDFWWFTTNGNANNSKATLTQLNSTIRWCDSDEDAVSEDCAAFDTKFNRWEYSPAGKDWDRGVLNRRTLDGSGNVQSTISMYKS